MSHDYSSGSEHYSGTRHAGPTNSAGTVKPAGGNKCACYTKIKITEKDGFSQTWGRQIRNPQLLSIQMRYGMSFEHSDPFQRPVDPNYSSSTARAPEPGMADGGSARVAWVPTGWILFYKTMGTGHGDVSCGWLDGLECTWVRLCHSSPAIGRLTDLLTGSPHRRSIVGRGREGGKDVCVEASDRPPGRVLGTEWGQRSGSSGQPRHRPYRRCVAGSSPP